MVHFDNNMVQFGQKSLYLIARFQLWQSLGETYYFSNTEFRRPGIRIIIKSPISKNLKTKLYSESVKTRLFTLISSPRKCLVLIKSLLKIVIVGSRTLKFSNLWKRKTAGCEERRPSSSSVRPGEWPQRPHIFCSPNFERKWKNKNRHVKISRPRSAWSSAFQGSPATPEGRRVLFFFN